MRFYRSTHRLMFLLGDFNVHHKDCLTYSDVSGRTGELCYNFSTSNDVTQLVNFPTQTQLWLSQSWFFYFFLSSYARICFTTAFTPLGNSDHDVASVCSDFPWNSLRDAMSNHIAYHISSNEHLTSNKRRPLISASPLGMPIEISTSPLISATPLNVVLIRIVAIFY